MSLMRESASFKVVLDHERSGFRIKGVRVLLDQSLR